MKILILGGGAVGTLVARRLIREKNEVVIVEDNVERCEELEEILDAKVVLGDASNIRTLKRAGLADTSISHVYPMRSCRRFPGLKT